MWLLLLGVILCLLEKISLEASFAASASHDKPSCFKLFFIHTSTSVREYIHSCLDEITRSLVIRTPFLVIFSVLTSLGSGVVVNRLSVWYKTTSSIVSQC